MPERFGLKDLVVLAAVALLGVIVLLKMWQDDRAWDKLEALQSELQTQREMIASLPSALPHTSTNPHPAQRALDASWSVPGVEIVWLAPRSHPNDPRERADSRSTGTITEILKGDPLPITPYLYNSSYGQRIVDLVCEPLMERDFETLEDRAALAIAYQVDPGGLWCRARLDQTARFSDGKPVTAEDVRWTYHGFIMNPQLQTDRWRASLGVIEQITAIDAHTVEFRFESPDFRNLEAALRMLTVLPKHQYEQIDSEAIASSPALLVGSGPFRLNTSEPASGAPIELVRNEFYNRPDAPTIDRLRFLTITDRSARLEAITNSVGDICEPTSAQLDAWSRDPENPHRLLAWENARSGYTFMTWNCESKPFSDARVRRAMTMLLDRDRIVRDLYYSMGSVCAGPFSSRTSQSDPGVEPLAFDIAGAASLLAQAGWVDKNDDGFLQNAQGEVFEFTYTHAAGSSSGPRLGAYLQDQCATVGIRCNVEAVEFGAYLQSVREGTYEAASFKWRRANLETDPYQLWHSASGDNMSRWRSDRADALIERGRSTTDHGARMRIWHELHRLIHEQQPVTFLVETPDLRIVHERISNVHAYPYGLNVAEMTAGER